MREILFRGKRANNRGWAEGLLFHHCEKASSIWSDELDRAVWVAPETVGQFTGRIDKNGKKVFEHDILQICDGVSRGIIQWWENDQCYVLATKEGWHIDDFGNYGRPEYYEVIGNIHDNPELMREAQ